MQTARKTGPCNGKKAIRSEMIIWPSQPLSKNGQQVYVASGLSHVTKFLSRCYEWLYLEVPTLV
jgi:hypothetical protein